LRTTGTILLFLLMGYTQWGYPLQSIIQQMQIKEAAREAWIASLPDKSFERISLADIGAHGRLQDGGRECWYRGRLYDIIRKRKEGSTTWLFCLNDRNEEQLIHRSDAATKTNLDHHSLTVSFADLVCETPHWRILPPRVNARVYFFCSDRSLPVCFDEILIPPPRA
jgi:hypothetical protein